MAFYGSQFIFDGVPCSEYGLMLYDIDGITEDGEFTSAVEIEEDRTAWRYSPLHYGATQNKPLTFTLVFGADESRIDDENFLDRWEMSTIASWLTGHDTYKYLEIEQPDMNTFRYKCIITELRYTTYGKVPWAFECTVTCDSPFAYTYPESFQYDVNDTLSISFYNLASCKYYRPKIVINIQGGNSFSIINHSDNDREFLFTGLETVPITIEVDNENEIISNSADLNLYGNFTGYKFLRLVRGSNELEFVGNGSVAIMCEFPIDIGG